MYKPTADTCVRKDSSTATPKGLRLKLFYVLTFLVAISCAVLRLSTPQKILVQQVFRRPSPKANVRNSVIQYRTSTGTLYTSNHSTTVETTAAKESTTVKMTSDMIKEQQMSFEFVTNTSTSFYNIVDFKENYQLCDAIEITITLRTSKNKTKTYGGDFIWVWVYDINQKASSTADEIIDNRDGTFTAKITPRWTGKTMVGVSLVHSSEIVSHLRFFRETYPARYSYIGSFKWPTGNKVVKGSCHVTERMYVPVKERYKDMVYCNFTDFKTGFPWFCLKPLGPVGCDSYINHRSGGSATEFHRSFMSTDFVKYYLRPSQIQPLNSSYASFDVTPTPRTNTTFASCLTNGRPLCTSCLPTQRFHHVPPGFYYNDTWMSLVCKNRHFTHCDVINCLKNHTVRFIGDSTLRQWYEYLARFVLKTTVQETRSRHDKFGPHIAMDKTNNITLYFNFHGYPIALSEIHVSQIHYVSEQLDSITDLNSTIICLCLWAHFTGTNLQYYRDRLQSVKEAIVRLKQRNPNVRIILKSANTREHSSDFDRSNWYSWEINKVMQEMFSGFPGVTLIDVWSMTIGHRTGYILHPKIEVISQEMDMFLSYLCPDHQSGQCT